jgi:murein L,D-transpeptidase YcbB/YkuD
MKSLIICVLVLIATVTSQFTRPQVAENQEVVDYLVKNGYLQEPYTNHSLRRSLRQFQRENELTINGRFSEQTVNLIKTENDRQLVLDYLKIFGYIQNPVTPLKTTNAIKQLQQNSGVLSQTGVIDIATIEFIKAHHPRGYSEGLYS